MIRKRTCLFYAKLLWLNTSIFARFIWLQICSLSRRKYPLPDSPKITPKKNKPLLFIYSQVPWFEVWQRPQEIASRFSHFLDVVFFSPMQAHRKIENPIKWKRKIVYKSKKHRLTVISPIILSGHYKFPLVFKINSKIMMHAALPALKKHNQIFFLTNSPFSYFFLENIKFAKSVYDVIDEFVAFGWAPKKARHMENSILKHVDHVFTGTYSLFQKKRSKHHDVQFIPCGVKFNMFYQPDNPQTPDDINNIKKPIIGYTGSISERLDSQLIAKISSTYKDASLVLIGPIHGDLRNYPSAPNIHYLGLKPHDMLPHYIKHFDLALIPFKLNEASRAVNPVKTLEYLSAAIPVLSTAIPDLQRFYADTVTIAHSHDEFITLTGRLLSQDNSKRIQKGLEMARNSSWDAMIQKMKNTIFPNSQIPMSN